MCLIDKICINSNPLHLYNNIQMLNCYFYSTVTNDIINNMNMIMSLNIHLHNNNENTDISLSLLLLLCGSSNFYMLRNHIHTYTNIIKNNIYRCIHTNLIRNKINMNMYINNKYMKFNTFVNKIKKIIK